MSGLSHRWAGNDDDGDVENDDDDDDNHDSDDDDGERDIYLLDERVVAQVGLQW